jgi:hypothetical protein
MRFSQTIKDFIEAEGWTFAKTMPEWPHEYLVKEQVDPDLFEATVRHIREHGFEGQFYQKAITYFAEDGTLYWTMGAPLEKTIIINRCREEDSYENRRRSGTLPKEKRTQDQRAEQDGAANRSQPGGSEASRTPSAAGSGR